MNNYHIIMVILICVLFLSYFIARKFPIMKKAFIVEVLLTNFIYICVRFTSIPIHCGIPSFIIGLILFIAEFLGLFAFCVYTFIFTGKRNQPKKTLNDLNGNIPTVDVLICTYNEDLDLLSKTIIAAQKLDYPKDKFKVYVLDDGHRSNLKDMCDKYNVNYITRAKNTNAKAGNINNALQFINGELFAVLDADMICKKDFLKHTVGYFSDDNLAFVHILLLILSIVSIISGTIHLEKTIHYQPYFINLFWILYNIPGLILSIKVAYQPPRQFANEGIPVKNATNIEIVLENKSILADITEVSEKYFKIKLIPDLQEFLYNGKIVTIKINDINYLCIVKKVTSNIATLKYKDNLSYIQLSHIMDLLLTNLSPFKNNMKL